MPLPTNKQLRRFVEVEGWQDKDKASKKKNGDHDRYTFVTPRGEILYTRISHGKDEIHNPGLFAHILRDQLQIDEDQFWAAVNDGIKPKRPSATIEVPTEGVDYKLASNLIKRVGLNPQDLAGMSQAKATQIWNDWLSSGSA